jgi:putative ABC transport system ATP-binding protein
MAVAVTESRLPVGSSARTSGGSFASAHADKLPATLSGGEQQRVAIARALANEPPLVLADEPTGNLDSVTATAILDLFRDMANRGTTVVIATHEADIARVIDRRIEISDGALVNQ